MANPNLFIIGAPKCGTSSLAYYLNQHPDVGFSRPKEPHYLAQDLDWVGNWGMHEEGDYFSLFDHGSKYRGDASTWYLYSDMARKKIMSEFPDSKVIVCLRHPVNFMESLWWHLRSRGRDLSKTLPHALEKELLVKKGLADFEPAPFRKAILYSESSNYGKYLLPYIENIPPKNLKIVLLEDIATNLEKTMREVFLFLEIDIIELEDASVRNRAFNGDFL
ncbi:MAG: sulfotransferase domain-containing protein, partial [Bacteroidota bacterium]